ncbi:MAG: OmpA family protein [Flavobacteriales bacterium]|nr:OmpA family protein [Flavobacteriales bacterium]
MKKYIILFLAVFLTLNLSAQDKKIQKGNEYYNGLQYSEAIEIYETLDSLPEATIRNLADCYSQLGNRSKAVHYYAMLNKVNTKESEDLYKYAMALKAVEQYEDSEQWLARYRDAVGDSIANERGNTGSIRQLVVDMERYKIRLLEMNSKEQDFGTSYYKDQVVFTSSKKAPSMVKRSSNSGLSFTSIQVANKQEDGELTDIKEFSKKLGGKYNQGPVTFSKDGTYMVFASNDLTGSDNEEDGNKIQLYFCDKTEKEWSEPQAFHFNSSQYSVGHPSLTGDGKTLYFVSNMTGGLGGTDLYKVSKQADGKWGKPENLGAPINTKRNEVFPFIHSSGMLLFSSNGHQGLGGLDLFYTETDELKSKEIINMGNPVNGPEDDFAILLNNALTKGYFSSNRATGEGSDDIYAIDIIKDLRSKTITGTVTNLGNEPLDKVKIMLMDNAQFKIDSAFTNANGEFYFLVSAKEKEYVVTASLNEELKNSIGIKTTINQNTVEANLKLIEKEDITEVIAEVVEKTNDRADAEAKSEEIADAKAEAIADAEAKAIADAKVKAIADADGEAEVGKTIIKYLFEVNKDEITQIIEKDLDAMVALLKANPNYKMKVVSHADCRGAASYNLELTERRLKSVLDYLSARKISSDRIIGEAVGETHPLINCHCESGTSVSSCSDEEHNKNRRMEFLIVE